MSYVGKRELKSSDIKIYTATSSTSATHTLTWTPPNAQSLIVTINGVSQHSDAYSVATNVVTLTSALVATDKLQIIGIQDVGQTVVPGTNTITNDHVSSNAEIAQSKLATLAITDSEVADNALSGNKIDGGTISNFASTGIDDNSDATAITIDSSEQVGIQLATTPAAPLHVKVTSGSGTATEVARFETTGHSDASAVVTDYRTAHTRGEINLVDGTGSYDSNIVFKTATGTLLAAPTEKIRIGPSGEIGIGGATFGTSGQALLSGGAGSAVSWGSVGGTNTPAFFASLAPSQTLSDNVATKITIGNERVASDDYDSSTNYRFTPTTAGTYYIFATCVVERTNWMYRGQIYIKKNGSSWVGNTGQGNSSYPIGKISPVAVAMDTANGTGDYYEVFYWADTYDGNDANCYGDNEAMVFTSFGAFKLLT